MSGHAAIYAERQRRLAYLQDNPEALVAIRLHYAECPWDFVQDWGMTFDPRAIERDEQPLMPFILWPRQREWLEWVHDSWRNGRRGLCEKSRDCGVTWLAAGYSVTEWLFRRGFTVGFGSRKEELVDKLGDPKSIFEKIRTFLDYVPGIFMPSSYDSAYMRLVNRDNGASIIGEAGDNIGRGGRTSVYFVDEAAHVANQDAVDKALSANTNCQIDISSVNGPGNRFYSKRQRWNGTDRIFIFDWRDDPRKDDAWYARQLEEQDEATVAQEVDRDYNAAVPDIFIPSKWLQSAVDSHKRLGFVASGIRVTGFDPADTGDAKAVAVRYGSVLLDADQMTAGDITQAIPWAFAVADKARSDALVYDGDGMGAPVMKLALQSLNPERMRVLAYHGSGGVVDPGKSAGRKPTHDEKSPTDTYANYRAQAWTWLYERFRKTHVAVERAKAGQLVTANPEELISLSSECKRLQQVIAELATPKRMYTENGKILVESKKQMKARGVASPNLADAVVMAFSARAPTRNNAPIPRPTETSVYDAGVGY